MSEEQGFWERPEQVERFRERPPDHRLEALLAEHPAGEHLRLLDLGTAGGRNAELALRRGCDVVALDASAAMVEATRARLAPLLGQAEARRRVLRGRMDELSWLGDGEIDLVVALGVYHNAASRTEWDRALAESARVLAPGGRLLVSVFDPRSDLTGDGVRPVPGRPHLYDGLPAGRAFLVDAGTLDREMARHGLIPERPTETVEVPLERGRRVTVNGLYRKG